MAPLPIKFQELVQLSTVGVDAQSIGFNSCVSTPPIELTPAAALELPTLTFTFPASRH